MENMPLRVGAVLMVLAMLAAYIVPRVACEVPLGENCGTDTECECMYGEQR